MELLKTAGYIVGGLFILIIVALVLLKIWVTIQTWPRRKREPGFEYIYVEDDGNARELTPDEIAYLKTKFHPADSGRPYIKFRYDSLTPDGRLGGYLRRRQLPPDIIVRPVPSKQG